MGGETLELPGGRVVGVARLGDPEGRPVLYFHGLPGSRLDLASADQVFADAGLNVVAFDRPGFGLSTPLPGRTLLDWPRDVEALAEQLGLERFGVVGYSSGGKYAAACAHALADRVTVAGIVAGNGPPDMPGFRDGLDSTDRLSLLLARRARPLALAYWGAVRMLALRRPAAFVAQFERMASQPDREVLAVPELRAAVLRSLQEGLRPGAGGVVDDYAVEATPWGFRLMDVRARVMVWHGERDEIVPPAHSRYVAAAIPGAELSVLEGAGHLVLEQLPTIAHRLAEAWAGRQTAPPPASPPAPASPRR
jgi:pimeloyl-ACP methyl ester carboxylesterase